MSKMIKKQQFQNFSSFNAQGPTQYTNWPSIIPIGQILYQLAKYYNNWPNIITISQI